MSGGFPHSDIPGSKGALASPGLNAECHVLHRLLLPRHPPNALIALDPIQKKTGPFARGRFMCLNPSCLFGRKSLDPGALLGKGYGAGLRSMNDPHGPDIKSRSVLDLERLSSSPMSRRTSGRPIPHLGKARRRLVYCSLDDVKCRDPEIGQRSRGVNPRAWQSGPIAAL